MSHPPGGSTFAEDANLPANQARILWRAEHDPSAIAVAAEATDPDCADCFELNRLGPAATVVVAEGRERVTISDGLRRIRLDVEEGTLLNGPVRLHYRLAGIADVEAKLVTIRRLIALAKLGRLVRSFDAPAPRRAEKLILALRAYDLAVSGATQREIAVEFIGDERVAADWRTGSDSLRYRVQRLLRNAAGLVDGGYRNLMRN